MKTVNTHDAKTHLSRILSDVESGEEYIVARAGKPIARLIPYLPSGSGAGPDKWRGRVEVAEDFDAPDLRIRLLFED